MPTEVSLESYSAEQVKLGVTKAMIVSDDAKLPRTKAEAIKQFESMPEKKQAEVRAILAKMTPSGRPRKTPRSLLEYAMFTIGVCDCAQLRVYIEIIEPLLTKKNLLKFAADIKVEIPPQHKTFKAMGFFLTCYLVEKLHLSEFDGAPAPTASLNLEDINDNTLNTGAEDEVEDEAEEEEDETSPEAETLRDYLSSTSLKYNDVKAFCATQKYNFKNGARRELLVNFLVQKFEGKKTLPELKQIMETELAARKK